MRNLLSKVILATLIPIGAWVLHGFASSNGLIQAFEDLAEQDVLSDGFTKFSRVFTGVEGLDRLLRTLLNFFWPVVNGSDPRLSLYSFMFAGQGVPLMILNMLEGYRQGNRSRIISFVTIYGLLYMVVGLAMMAPSYLLLHLFTSPTAVNPTQKAVVVEARLIRSVLFGVTIGYVFPTIFMVLPHPSVISTDAKASAVILWQAMPLWAAMSASVWGWVEKSIHAAKPPAKDTALGSLRWVYFVATSIAAISHVATLSISIKNAVTSNAVETAISEGLQPYNLLLPVYPFTTKLRIPNFIQGATWFLQWDYVLLSVSYMIWGFTIRYFSGLQENPPSFSGWAEIIVAILMKLVVLGPLGTTLHMVWERDEKVIVQPLTGPESCKKAWRDLPSAST